MLRNELYIVEQWLSVNKLTLNSKKTKYMLFGTKHKISKLEDFELHMGGSTRKGSEYEIFRSYFRPTFGFY